MTYRVELAARAVRDLKRIFGQINAENSPQASAWFNDLEAAILSLDNHPQRSATTPENKALRHSLFGNKPDIYRIIYAIDERARIVRVLHIRHGARRAFSTPPTARSS